MEDEHSDALEQRVERLEAAIQRLERLAAKSIRAEKSGQTESAGSPLEENPLEKGAASSPLDSIATDENLRRRNEQQRKIKEVLEGRRTAKRTESREKTQSLIDSILSTENWLSKVGIALLLFSLAFLFKYSVDQGWLTPGVRLLFGVGLGIVLIVFSVSTHNEKRYLSLVLFGGGLASFFVTGFAAVQLFTLVTHLTGYIFLVSVTLLAFVASLRQEEPVMAFVALLGGFATPFVLYSDSGTLAGLMIYSCLLIYFASAIYFYKGWRYLMWLTVLGGWCILAFGVIVSSPFSVEAAAGDRWPMQIGIVCIWAALALVPYFRVLVSEREADSRPRHFVGDEKRSESEEQKLFRHQLLSIHFATAPLMVLVFSAPIWTLADLTAGLIILAGAFLYGGAAALQLRGEKTKRFAPAHALAAVLLLTIALMVMLDGRILLLALTAEALVISEAGLLSKQKYVRYVAHALFIGILYWMVARLGDAFAGSTSIFNPDGLSDLAVLVAAAIVAFRSTSNTEKWIYGGITHLCFLGLLYREFSFLENGQGIVTISWGAVAVIFFIYGLMQKESVLRILGSFTLLIVVAKLFLVDLAALETIWRVLLFMGFGALFLLLSYFFNTFLQEEDEEDD